MGVYLNPGNENFRMALNSKIYVDKSGLITYTNSVLKTEQRFICVSRPRRFGKSMTANMLAAYYGKAVDSESLFQNLLLSKDKTFKEHLNQYNVIFEYTELSQQNTRYSKDERINREIVAPRFAQSLSECQLL